MNAVWTAYEAAAATGGALCARGGDPDDWSMEEWSARGLSIDTRTLKPGEIFLALKDARDGHDFVPAAFKAGASAAVVSRTLDQAPDGAPLLVVPDTMAALRDLAAVARDRNFGKRIGVTGSAGKTSTKEILRTVLAACGRAHAADKSFNNYLGVPLTLAALPLRADYSVYEIGMNHAGEITPLTELVRPHAAIVTTVGEAHLEFFDSVEGIAEAKAEIFRGLPEGGAAIIPLDNAYAPLLTRRALEAGARIITFGESEQADYRLTGYRPGEEGAEIEAAVPEGFVTFRLAATGRHQALNALIDESYNANPASMRAALAGLAETEPGPGGRRIVVFGDMLELGPDAPALHAGLAPDLENAGVGRLYVAGDLAGALQDAVPEAMRAGAADAALDLADRILAEIKDGDVLMAKGSNASRVGALIARLREIAEPAEGPPAAPDD
ncbi:MAG: Mur ligase family protein [Pseudomonadota bacterium]